MNELRIFDWDDNLFYMPTKIKMDQLINNEWLPINVSNHDFKKFRELPEYRLHNNSFNNFIDDEAFKIDIKESINTNSIGPQFLHFLNILRSGLDFAIVTGRGHSKNAINFGIHLIIEEFLTINEKEYLNSKHTDIKSYIDNQSIFAVDSQEFKLLIFGVGESSDINWELYKYRVDTRKVLAIDYYIRNYIDNNQFKDLRIHFSDDDPKNILTVLNYLRNLKLNNMISSFYIYDTSLSIVNLITE
jgi:hypothetical protein